MVAMCAAIVVALFVSMTEVLHARRVSRLGYLAFGPNKRPSRLGQFAPVLRILSLTCCTWGLVTLMAVDPQIHGKQNVKEEESQHLIVLLDVSPSMDLQDAGTEGKQTRKARGKELLESIFQRTMISSFKTSVFAVYTDAFAVVEETTDPEVISNILNDLPLFAVFESGKTNLFSGLEKAAALAKNWTPDSTSVIIVSDGDTVPASGMPKMPAAVGEILVLGVGDATSGKFIDGHQSRQDVSTLNQIAIRLGGHYHNGNKLHLDSKLARTVMAVPDALFLKSFSVREYALIMMGVGSFVLAMLPVLLDRYGTTWNPGRMVKREWRESVSREKELVS